MSSLIAKYCNKVMRAEAETMEQDRGNVFFDMTHDAGDGPKYISYIGIVLIKISLHTYLGMSNNISNVCLKENLYQLLVLGM